MSRLATRHATPPMKRFFVLCLAYGVLAVSGSLVVEHGWEIRPCRLCRLQMALLTLLVGISVLGLVVSWQRFILALVHGCLFVSCAVSIYHFAIQMGWIADPCRVPRDIASLAAFRQLLEAQVPCSKVHWSLFRLPISLWNSLVLGGLMLMPPIQRFIMTRRGQDIKPHKASPPLGDTEEAR